MDNVQRVDVLQGLEELAYDVADEARAVFGVPPADVCVGGWGGQGRVDGWMCVCIFECTCECVCVCVCVVR